jgi:two-component system, LuxR family, response regulator FixJ
MPTQGTVFVVDDDLEVRQSWECILAASELPVRSFPTAEAFLAEADCSQPCCLVLDLRMPGMGGQRLLETLRLRHSALPVFVISGHADVPTVIQTMKLGLVDFLTKPVDPTLVVTKIRDVLTDVAAGRAREGEKLAVQARLATLSQRETDVLLRLIRGRLHKQIAGELGISTRTVDHHHAQINLKMQANNLADLMHMGFLAGLD